MAKLNSLLQEALAASVAICLLDVVVAAIYWLTTDTSPWPLLVLVEAATFGPAVALLALTSPRSRSER